MTNESQSGSTPDNPLTASNSISIGSLLETSPPLDPRYPYQDVRVSDNDRFQHVYMVGMTGGGKSNALKHLIAQDIQNPQKGVIVFSPDALLLEEVRSHIPENRSDDLLYFDPTKVYGEKVVGWNPLDFSEAKDLPDAEWQPLYQQKVASVFKVLSRTLENVTEPQKELLLEAIYGLVALDQVTLKDFDTLLDPNDPTLRQAIANARRMEERTRRFWRDYDNDTSRQASATTLLKKLISLFHEPLDRLFSSHAFTWSDLLAHPRIVFIDLSQIGSPAKETVAELILAEIEVGNVRREHNRREKVPYYIYIDEFADFIRAGESSNELFAKARKNSLGLTLSHQSHDGLNDDLQRALMNNIKTKIVMRMSDQDARFYARILQQESRGSLDPAILQNLQLGQAIVGLEAGGVPYCVAVSIPRFA